MMNKSEIIQLTYHHVKSQNGEIQIVFSCRTHGTLKDEVFPHGFALRSTIHHFQVPLHLNVFDNPKVAHRRI